MNTVALRNGRKALINKGVHAFMDIFYTTASGSHVETVVLISRVKE
jgi:hypothetical protein